MSELLEIHGARHEAVPLSQEELLGRAMLVNTIVDGYFNFQSPEPLRPDDQPARWQHAMVMNPDTESNSVRCDMFRTPELFVAAGGIRSYRVLITHRTPAEGRSAWSWTDGMSMETKAKRLPTSDTELAEFLSITSPGLRMDQLASVPRVQGMRPPLYVVPPSP